ncbi:MAG: histidinol dehydrogenase, partial [Oscillospiraceae bacterium]|nr:histidinol dehydrogenase [Oscillospiraceae bacterium]
MIRILNSSEIDNSEIFERKEAVKGLEGIVAAIIENVKTRGDAALFEYAEKFDGGLPGGLEVTEEEIDEAFASVPAELIEVMREAEENIRAFHSKQVRNGFTMTEKEGVILGQRVTPIEKVGIYVPGGTAAYPSTVLMNAVPAKIAGCGEIVMVTPAKAGKVSPAILAAAKIAGVT